MEEQSPLGVIFQPEESVEILIPTQSEQENYANKQLQPAAQNNLQKVLGMVVLVSVIGLIYMVYHQYNQVQSMEAELVNAQNQLKESQNQYGSTFQEKVTLQSALARLTDTQPSTPSSSFFTVKQVIDKPQKVAQSFQPNSSAPVKLVGIQIFSNYAVGKKLILTLYEYQDKFEENTASASATVNAEQISQGKPVNFLFEKSVVIDPKKEYIFVVESDSTGTEADVEFTSNDTDNTGWMYEYAIRTGKNNEVLDISPTWRALEQQDLKYNALIEK